MKKEIRIFFTALMFLTRLPVPPTTDHGDEYLRQAPRYFPVTGWIVGGFCSLAFWLFRRFISPDIGIMASMITGLLVTGCFHEDGFADVCDGMGGGWTKEKILLIMKDSRIGAYGAIGLVSILAAKFLLLKELRYIIPAVLIAHTVSRLMPVLVMKLGVYASDPDQSKVRPLAGPPISATSLMIAASTAIIPFFLLPRYFPVVILPALAATYAMYRWFFKWIGGYTGDCLGAIQQVTEITVYLGCVVLWRYL
ncbi:MAG TPA: adenosylcobinamide-GDP ribazoletransferase [Puia sp.]|nr:adenosylcobinamide-GDP ribazoletransferase [Puia sp.]